MIIYDTRYLNVFQPVSADYTVISVLNSIQGVSIEVTGKPVDSYDESTPPYAGLTGIIYNDGVPTFKFNICIPILWGDELREFSAPNGIYNNEGEGIRITVDHDIHEKHNIELIEPVYLRMRSLDIYPQRRITINGSGDIKISKGHNVDVKFDRNTLHIIGGAGLGLGRYKGSEVPASSQYYYGIKSINGIRSTRNVTIRMSDALIQEELKPNEKTQIQ